MSTLSGADTLASGPGVQSFTTRDGRWRISTRKRPILKAEPIEEMHAKIGIPIPEMIFGENYVAIEHIQSGTKVNFNAYDALDRVSKTEEGMLQVAYSEEWKKDRQHQEGIKGVVKPFDWSYSTDFRGTTSSNDDLSWQQSSADDNPVRTDLLSRPDPILFFDEVVLYEDELADNGIAMLSCKVRVMPERLLLLCRFFLRLDGVIVRVRDTRVYVEFATGRIIRQYTVKEDSYDNMRNKLNTRRENVPEALRDANLMASLLPVVDDITDFLDVANAGPVTTAAIRPKNQ
ncbi:TIP41-domain-containing protein [Myriangium duriaei CBS 260.36]|uniref:TIP41-domain-containing protein n=1 Tax=Myriangium duriaei CBS 260.36 TaxID=1168546 RepID=A0A9P4IYE4_9PEZI|nr:TIP41-domain-containing protein [Myriangium duriaei CBS 260.36]